MTKAAFVGLLMTFSLGVFAQDCEYPKNVNLPNGKTATKDDMLTGQKDVKTYIAAAEAYLACIEAREKETETNSTPLADDAVNQERKALWSKRHNAMVSEMEAVADNFNVEVREYKAAQK